MKRLETELKRLNARHSRRTACGILLHPTMTRYVKELKSGRLVIDKAAITEDEKRDGKYLLSSSDPSLSAEDIALGYKQLLEVERGFRTLKTTLSLRPLYHSKDDRIRAHVLLCWVALLLVRIAETETGLSLSWTCIRREMQRLHLGEFVNKRYRIHRHTKLMHDQRNILNKMNIKPPKPVITIDSTS